MYTLVFFISQVAKEMESVPPDSPEMTTPAQSPTEDLRIQEQQLQADPGGGGGGLFQSWFPGRFCKKDLCRKFEM